MDEKDINLALKRTRTSAARTIENIRACIQALTHARASLHTQTGLQSHGHGSQAGTSMPADTHGSAAHADGADGAGGAESGRNGVQSPVATLKATLRGANILSVAKDDHKHVHASLSKLSKAVPEESTRIPARVFACVCQQDALNAAIVDYLARSGHATAAALVCGATHAAMPVLRVWRHGDSYTLCSLPSLCAEVHALAARVRQGDTLAAATWCDAVGDKQLRAWCEPDLPFRLAVLHMTQLLRGRLWVGKDTGRPIDGGQQQAGQDGDSCSGAKRSTATAHDGMGHVSHSRLVLIEDPVTAGALALAFARSTFPRLLAYAGGDAAVLPRSREVARLVTAATFLGSAGMASAASHDTRADSCCDILQRTPYADLASGDEAAMVAANAIARARSRQVEVSLESPLQWVVQAGLHAEPMLQLTSSALKLASDSSFGGSGAPLASPSALAHARRTRSASFGGVEAIGGDFESRAVAAGVADASTVEIPVDVPLPDKLHFHSVFSCPVSRQPTNPATNPPCILPCGHVISRESLQRLAAHRPRFKCPTCPVMLTQSQAVELKLE